MDNRYQLIQPPFPLKFKEMSKSHANEYFLWFQEQIPVRIIELSDFVKSFPEYASWEPNQDSLSFNSLGKWFFGQVKVRKRSRAEIDNIYAGAVNWFRSNFEIPDWDLSDVTFSLSIDIGMYLGRTLEQNIQNSTWRLGSKPKSSINYQQPVLVGSGKVEFNPVHIVTTLAYGIANQTKGPERLRELYDIWYSLLKNGD